ncbi:hypothetical protein T02_9203 [Trichinella nativa]|uniref:Uncharacterized protein n=1 Tax=Trichinella nativa TaxID=6335 RepID=A0A0V1LJD6_9BILA|nr:hypothetical protein T02_9203 [Trichinella nativa]
MQASEYEVCTMRVLHNCNPFSKWTIIAVISNLLNEVALIFYSHAYNENPYNAYLDSLIKDKDKTKVKRNFKPLKNDVQLARMGSKLKLQNFVNTL